MRFAGLRIGNRIANFNLGPRFVRLPEFDFRVLGIENPRELSNGIVFVPLQNRRALGSQLRQKRIEMSIAKFTMKSRVDGAM